MSDDEMLMFRAAILMVGTLPMLIERRQHLSEDARRDFDKAVKEHHSVAQALLRRVDDTKSASVHLVRSTEH